jgi:hypothetical protein
LQRSPAVPKLYPIHYREFESISKKALVKFDADPGSPLASSMQHHLAVISRQTTRLIYKASQLLHISIIHHKTEILTHGTVNFALFRMTDDTPTLNTFLWRSQTFSSQCGGWTVRWPAIPGNVQRIYIEMTFQQWEYKHNIPTKIDLFKHSPDKGRKCLGIASENQTTCPLRQSEHIEWSGN